MTMTQRSLAPILWLRKERKRRTKKESHPRRKSCFGHMGMRRGFVLVLGAIAANVLGSDAFIVNQQPHRRPDNCRPGWSTTAADNNKGEHAAESLKAELQKYLAKRKEVGADELAQQSVGTSVGGTRGNAVLDYVSLAPNKGSVIESAPNVFDYSELDQYGFAHLATPIMQAGGRLAMYDLLGLDRPTSAPRTLASSEPAKLEIDRTGQNDRARYQGLKLGQVLDDEVQALALAEAQRKFKEGQSLRPKLLEEDYEQPFADRRNVGPVQQGYWTAEKLDEWGKMKGKQLADAKRAQDELLVIDQMESIDLEFPQRIYSIFATLLVATAFGKSTPEFLSMVAGLDDSALLLNALKVPALALLTASFGSSVVCALQAREKQRNSVVWTIKGLLGGPLTLRQLRELPKLITRRELDALKKKEQ